MQSARHDDHEQCRPLSPDEKLADEVVVDILRRAANQHGDGRRKQTRYDDITEEERPPAADAEEPGADDASRRAAQAAGVQQAPVPVAPPAVEPGSGSSPFAGASRHQPPAGAAQPPSSPFASESRHQPADISPAGPSVAKAALQAAVAASSRSIDALVRARDQLQKQIDEERQNHATLVQLAEQAGRHGAA